MSGSVPRSGGSEPPPPPTTSASTRTLLVSLAVLLCAISFAGVVVTLCVIFCRLRRGRSTGSESGEGGSARPAARSGARGGGGGGPFPADETLPAAFAYARHQQPGEEHGGGGGSARECTVCLGEVKEGEMVRQLPACQHLYHVGCIDRWLAAHRTCPLCRLELDSCKVGRIGLNPLASVQDHQPV